MEINYLNDGKEKCNSHEMWVNIDFDCYYVYGESFEDVLETFKEEMRQTIEKLQNIDYTKFIEVNGFKQFKRRIDLKELEN